MLAKTHFSVGAALSVMLTQPDTIPKLVLAVGVGGFGALISDIDVGTSESHKEANKVIAGAGCLAAVLILCDYFFKLGIWERVMNDSNILRIVTGVVMFLGVCIYGKDKPHRSFMHSFMAMILLSFALGLVWFELAPYFAVGFFSHIMIDILNHKRVKLFYPAKHKGFALKICYADGFVNKIMFWLGCAVVAAECMFTVIKLML